MQDRQYRRLQAAAAHRTRAQDQLCGAPVKQHIEGYRITALWGSFPVTLQTVVPWDAGQSVWGWNDEPEQMEQTVIYTDRFIAHEIAGAIKAAVRPELKITNVSVTPFSGDAYPGQVDDSQSEAVPVIDMARAPLAAE